MAELSIQLSGITFQHPILPGSGPSVRSGDEAIAAARGGASALVTKTISVAPAKLTQPTLAKIGGGMLNAETWSELSKEQWLAEELPKAKSTGLPLIVQLGYTASQIRELVPLFHEQADAFELSTHYTGGNLLPIVSALEAAKKATDRPVYVKLSPHENIQQIAISLERAGADGLVLCNSYGPCMGINVETGRPYLSSDGAYGWLSGPALHAIALRCVYDAAKYVRIPIVGVGGVTSGREAAAMLMAGASLVQVCTQAILEGPQAFGRIAKELNAFLDEHGYQNAAQLRALALKANEKQQTAGSLPRHLEEKCRHCGDCASCCTDHAVHVSAHTWQLDGDLCRGCGLCISQCPAQALHF